MHTLIWSYKHSWSFDYSNGDWWSVSAVQQLFNHKHFFFLVLLLGVKSFNSWLFRVWSLLCFFLDCHFFFNYYMVVLNSPYLPVIIITYWLKLTNIWTNFPEHNSQLNFIFIGDFSVIFFLEKKRKKKHLLSCWLQCHYL